METTLKLDWETGPQFQSSRPPLNKSINNCGKGTIPPTAKRKLTDKYPDVNMEWDKVYSLPLRPTLKLKTREFQFKILNCIVCSNEKLYRFVLVASALCTFCQGTAESIEHLLFSREISGIL